MAYGRQRLYDGNTQLREVMENPEAVSLIKAYIPNLENTPTWGFIKMRTLDQIENSTGKSMIKKIYGLTDETLSNLLNDFWDAFDKNDRHARG